MFPMEQDGQRGLNENAGHQGVGVQALQAAESCWNSLLGCTCTTRKLVEGMSRDAASGRMCSPSSQAQGCWPEAALPDAGLKKGLGMEHSMSLGQQERW